MAGVIVPTAKPLMLCEEIDEEGGMLNVYGLFNALNAEAFSHTRDSFCVFVQLSGGLGEVPCHFDIRRASDDQLIHVSPCEPCGSRAGRNSSSWRPPSRASGSRRRGCI